MCLYQYLTCYVCCVNLFVQTKTCHVSFGSLVSPSSHSGTAITLGGIVIDVAFPIHRSINLSAIFSHHSNVNCDVGSTTDQVSGPIGH